ncbi:MAG: sodium:solute symporter family protein [Bacteroidota bacterium]
MHIIDLSIFVIYMAGMLGVGYYFLRTNKGADDYYVGGRKMSSLHIGLSVVATDVGGGFSIGLGGLGFTMGLSGSWMLFTGLIGAWLAAVFLIPKVKGNRAFDTAYTFPQVFKHYFNARVALVAGIISAIGYAGFTSAQILAGAKLANGTFSNLDLNTALIIMGLIAVIYTVMGGLKAVIYTDTIQWAILMMGLIFIGIPISYSAVGGWEAVQATLEPEMLTLTNVSWQDLVYWVVTIIPIWFVGMTLYQRIYACNDEKTAKRAWYLAAVFEWPIMAFMGVLLGLFAKVGADQGMFDYLGAANVSDTDPETGLPMLLRTVLPVGLMGLMMSAYFSAILSTADSCLMASSGNVVSDIIGHFRDMDPNSDRFLRFSQITTAVIGGLALILALSMTSVLDLMLQSYSFMVSGLFVPIIGALYWKKSSSVGALSAMIIGGATTVYLSSGLFPMGMGDGFLGLMWQSITLPYGLDPNVFGITASALVFVAGSLFYPDD